MRATQTECYDIRYITILFYSSVTFCKLTPILTWNCLWQSTVQKCLLHLTQPESVSFLRFPSYLGQNYKLISYDLALCKACNKGSPFAIR